MYESFGFVSQNRGVTALPFTKQRRSLTQLLKNKYFNTKSLTPTQGRPGYSHFWAGLVEVKDYFLKWGQFLV
jgi:hypothetical protein